MVWKARLSLHQHFQYAYLDPTQTVKFKRQQHMYRTIAFKRWIHACVELSGTVQCLNSSSNISPKFSTILFRTLLRLLRAF